MKIGKQLLGARVKFLQDWNEPVEKVINAYAKTRPVRCVFVFDYGYPVVFINDRITTKKLATKYVEAYITEYEAI